jgi:hypothetical protein
MFFRVCFLLLIFVSVFPGQVLAQILPPSVTLQCPQSAEDYNPEFQLKNATGKEVTRRDLEKLACHQIRLIQNFRQTAGVEIEPNNEFLDILFTDVLAQNTDIYIRNSHGYNDDLLATVLTSLLAADLWDWESGTPYRTWLGMLYANPSSEIYDEDLATHLFRRAALSNIKKDTPQENCDSKMQASIEGGTVTGLRQSGFQFVRFICQTQPKQVFLLARGYEEGMSDLMKDPAMALFLYERADYMGYEDAAERIEMLRLQKKQNYGPYISQQTTGFTQTNCAEEPNTLSKLSCLSSDVSTVPWAYIHFKPLSTLEPDHDAAKNILRLQGLNFDKAHNEKLIDRIKQHKIDEPEFIAMFEEAIIWAEEQKSKSGEELFALYLTVPDQIQQENLKDNFQSVFLRLSFEKKYKPAWEIMGSK